MISMDRWFEREFKTALTPGVFPMLVERLRGTPARVEEKVGPLPTGVLEFKRNAAWSIKENVGHLSDLEPLWFGRVDDLVSGAAELRAADLANTQTHNANHNATALDELLSRFRTARGRLVDRLESLTPGQVQSSATHPRLKQPMRMVEHLFFIAEHDDHHLAMIQGIREVAEK